MYRMRRWSVRNARVLKKLYSAIERILVWSSPLLRRIGYARLEKPFTKIESLTKGFLLDSQHCGQCIVGFTGLSCPMNCPKRCAMAPAAASSPTDTARSSPRCRASGCSRGKATSDCVKRNSRCRSCSRRSTHQLIGRSAWLREVRIKVESARHAV